MAAGVVAAVLGILARGQWTPLERLDTSLTVRLHGRAAARPALRQASSAVSTVAGPTSVRVGAALLALPLLRRQRTRAAVRLLVAVEGSGLLSVTVKALVRRPRPSLQPTLGTANGWGYPSGHALAAAVGVGALVQLPAPRPRAVLAGGVPVVLAVAGSRVALGVHRPGDVAGGWLLAVAWLGVARALVPEPPAAAAPR